jgi:hypothetical protein
MRRAAILVVIAFAGCGGGDERAQTTPTQPPATQPRDPIPTTPARPPDTYLPPIVPTEANGSAPPGAGKVVRAWASAVRKSDFERAADLFAKGARVQNGGPVEELKTRDFALVWNAALPCGAQVTKLGGANGFTIAEFKLTDRVGSTCGSGRGNAARVAFRVLDGKITEWYRLPSPQQPQGQSV